MAVATAVFPPLGERPLKSTLVLFDVDGTLTPARKTISPSMLQLLSALRQKTAIGFVGGSNLVKQQEQIGDPASTSVTSLFDYCFPENGLVAYRMGEPLPATSFISWLGESRYKKLVKFILRYIADLADDDDNDNDNDNSNDDGTTKMKMPVMRGTFVEFRNGMINVSPIGRNASSEERNAFEAFDREAKIREKMVGVLREEFKEYGLTFSIGGQISFDVFPNGWDKTYCLRHIENEKNPSSSAAAAAAGGGNSGNSGGGLTYTDIHFFGDKTAKGGNDYEIYTDSRTIGHSVRNPEETAAEVRRLFFS